MPKNYILRYWCAVIEFNVHFGLCPITCSTTGMSNSLFNHVKFVVSLVSTIPHLSRVKSRKLHVQFAPIRSHFLQLCALIINILLDALRLDARLGWTLPLREASKLNNYPDLSTCYVNLRENWTKWSWEVMGSAGARAWVGESIMLWWAGHRGMERGAEGGIRGAERCTSLLKGTG